MQTRPNESNQKPHGQTTMKRLFATSLLFASISAIAVSPDSIQTPESYGNTFVSDTANIIDDANEAKLDADLVEYYKTTGVQVAIVTTPDTDSSDSPRTFANQLFERLELGDPELDNGLLMLLSVGDRRIEFETGYGLEGLLPDVTQFRIQQKYMIPYFKEGDYQQGLLDGTYATLIELGKATKLEYGTQLPDAMSLSGDKTAQYVMPASDDAKSQGGLYYAFIIIGLGVFGLFCFMALFHLFRSRPIHKNKDKDTQPKSLNSSSSDRIILPCDYCHKTVINPDSPFEDTYTTNGKKHQHKYYHLTNYEKGLITHNIADVKLKSCPECRYTNKITTFKKDLMFCPFCLEKSRYAMADYKSLLSNSLNTYVDKIVSTRTQPLQSKIFTATKDDWQKTTFTRLTVSHCFLCGLILDETEKDSIPRPPKPVPVPRQMSVSTPSTSSSSSYTSKPRKRSTTSSYRSSSSRKSSISTRRSKPTPTRRKRGGKSGGGGAGSSW